MRRTSRFVFWLAVASGLDAGACVQVKNGFQCTTSDQCASGDTCQPDGWCSAPDPTCTSGQRYTATSGAMSNACVGAGGADGGVDAGPDACEGWKPMAQSPLAGRDQAGTFWTGSDFLIYGGLQWGQPSNGWFNDGARYNADTDSWTMINSVGAAAAYRWDASYAYGAGQMFVFGGHGATNLGGLYTMSSDSWVTPPETMYMGQEWGDTNTPEGRAYHVSYYAQGKFFVWGGEYSGSNASPPGDTPVTTGGIYDPSANSWQPMAQPILTGSATPFYPSGAYFASDSSDTQMFVWGGTQSTTPWMDTVGTSNITNTGAIYNYLHNEWQPMTTTNAPAARRNPRGVWDDRDHKFIVWGGFNENTVPFADGGIYDPNADMWAPIAPPTQPELANLKGSPAIMVWTGNHVLIWSTDYDRSNDLASTQGAAYDPSTGVWTPMTTVGAPGMDFYSGQDSNLWNGRQLIVWSGGNDTQYPVLYPNTGWLYTPRCGF